MAHEGYPAPKQGVHVLAETASGGVQLVAVVESCAADGVITVGCVDVARAAAITAGLAVTLEYFRDDAVCRLQTEVQALAKPASELLPWPRLVLAPSEKIRRLRRRRYPRAALSLPVRFLLAELPVGSSPASLVGGDHWRSWKDAVAASGHAGTTEVLSGSGLRLRSPVAVPRGDYAFLRIELPRGAVFSLARVVWEGRSEEGEKLVGFEYEGMASGDREAVLEFTGLPTP
jgi:c-di-GMP-binding flagellar brake protein YcgR